MTKSPPLRPEAFSSLPDYQIPNVHFEDKRVADPAFTYLIAVAPVMADPLSITTGVITILDAATKVVDRIEKIVKRLAIINSLSNDISELQLSFAALVEPGSVSLGAVAPVQNLIHKANVALDGISEFLEHQPKRRAYRWLERLRVSDVEKHQRSVREVKRQLEELRG
jgi:hypothetical protein